MLKRSRFIVVLLGLFVFGFSEDNSHAFGRRRVVEAQTQRYTATFAPNQFSREVFYYVPSSAHAALNAGKKLKTLVFLHGGGESTSTQADASYVAQMYLDEYKSFAEKSRILLVFPTSSIGWNFHTRYFLQDFISGLPQRLPVDPNNIVLAGHSMGGMGITREYAMINHLFSGVLALSAGTQPQYASDLFLLTYFNTPYVHINGLNDHFRQFKSRMRAVEKSIQALEKQLDRPSKFKLLFHPGGHNPDMAMVFQELDRLFSTPRNAYPKSFYGIFEARNHPINVVNPPIEDVAIQKIFWVELDDIKMPTEAEGSRGNRIHAQVKDQTISIQLDPLGSTTGRTLEARKLVLHLDSSLIKMKRPISVQVNGASVFSGVAKTESLKIDVSEMDL